MIADNHGLTGGLFADLNVVSQRASQIYDQAIRDYHLYDSTEAEMPHVYSQSQIEFLIYKKAWTDTVQWHVEDLIRDIDIEPAHALRLKRKIDTLNQDRTDIVEMIDMVIVNQFEDIVPLPDARINTESPAWALDRLSILCLKLYHMRQETVRKDARPEHTERCFRKLAILEEQHTTLSVSINELFHDISHGSKRMKVYKQMKMYNDLSLNPVMYRKLTH